MNKKVCVVGLGYIGLPTSLVFAKAGFEVVGVDVSDWVVQSLNAGATHIIENGIEEVFEEVRNEYKFKAQTTPESADAFIIAVPTPVNEDHTANLDYVVSATKSILPYLKAGNVVIVESTIPPRTTDDVVAPILAEAGWQVGSEIYLAHCPERVLPGSIFRELVENNRIVGGYNSISADKAADLYRTFVKGEIVLTYSTSAEMAKLMENTYRDVNIALANELAKASVELGVDALEVIQLANKHPRVKLHSPGPGVGGHCIAVDPYFIIEKAPWATPLMATAREINNSMPSFVVEQVEKIASPFQELPVAVFGLTYKGNVDDIRESPALAVVNLLRQRGYQVMAHDPHVHPDHCPIRLYSAQEALNGAHCLVVLADHNEFALLDENLLRNMHTPVILDTKNCLNVSGSSRATVYNYGNLHKIGLLEPVAAR
ncbi:nucleotide sugar dehydrogenase [Paenibacillus mesophilus]|uniref:nucleotide sugar dehydrogenase n=1 Tax=Paenibacillus mesophilus TaxID=2582849 RepID=UPI00110D321E|nr:nucleotide sugar dehydrogenase [Paenibacillus mesophilus]TMV47504.1 nucleotide sugar dehydrogenase [Paenibacillus mesophilus]